jgi:hypothetical protein
MRRRGSWTLLRIVRLASDPGAYRARADAQAAAFFREVARHRQVWYVRDEQGSPVPVTSSGKRAFPYWSSQARAQRAATAWGGGLWTVAVSVDAWRDKELPGLANGDYRVGINWSGPRLVGWDFTVPEVLNRLAQALGEGSYAGVDGAV